MVDHGLTKGVIIIPCSKTVDVMGIAKLFLSHVFKRFGLHDSLISDQGPQFTSAFARELARLLQYDVKLSTAYHPQTDGQTERTNQEIETYLCIFCANNPKTWLDFLPTAEFQHNSAPHHSTRTSPFVTEFVPLHNIPYIFLSTDRGPYFSIEEFLASPDRQDLSAFIPNSTFS